MSCRDWKEFIHQRQFPCAGKSCPKKENDLHAEIVITNRLQCRPTVLSNGNDGAGALSFGGTFPDSGGCAASISRRK
jgi:hypothetical protein